MTGVEILAMEEVAISYAFNWDMCLIIGVLIFVIMLIIGTAIGRGSDMIVWIIAGIVFGCLLGALSGSVTEEPTEYETQYKVTISDEVSMNDFLELYEIVDQEGKIYTVRERNDLRKEISLFR